MLQDVYKKQKHAFDQATHKGELLLRNAVKEPWAAVVRRNQAEAVVGTFAEMVQMHLRNVPSEGAIKSTHLTSLLEDAIQVPIGGAVEDGFQAIAFMAGRDGGLPKFNHRQVSLFIKINASTYQFIN